MIIEGDEFIYKDDFYQVVTNFYQSNPDAGWHPCWRFDLATRAFQECEEISLPFFREVTESICQNRVVYSYIFDVTNGKMFIYHNRSFEECLQFDVFAELAKGEREYEVGELFSDITDVYPEDGSTFYSSSQTFRWEGKAGSDYQIVYSTHPDFTGCEILNVAKQNNPDFMVFAGVCSLGILFASRNHRLKKSLLPLLFMAALVSCQHDGGENGQPSDGPQYTTHRITIDGLQPGTTYYWSVVARASADFATRTPTRSFTVE